MSNASSTPLKFVRKKSTVSDHATKLLAASAQSFLRGNPLDSGADSVVTASSGVKAGSPSPKAAQVDTKPVELPFLDTVTTPQVDRYAFDRFMQRPQVSTNLGHTARISKLLDVAELYMKQPQGPPKDAEREQWNLEKTRLQDIIGRLQAHVRRLRAGDTSTSGDIDEWVDAPEARSHAPVVQEAKILSYTKVLPVDAAILRELELLRRENQDLRNMESEEIRSKAVALLKKLRVEIDDLQKENKSLKDLIVELRNREGVKQSSAPPAFDKLPKLRGFYMSLDKIEQEQALQVLEQEWKNCYLASRHSAADPIKDPFHKRR